MALLENTERYYSELDENAVNGVKTITSPFEDGIEYDIYTRFYAFTNHWLIRIVEKNGGKEISTGWRRLAVGNSLNLEYKNVMQYNIGCESIFSFDPDTPDAWNNGWTKLFVSKWENA